MTSKRRRKIREDLYLKQKGLCKICGGRMPPLDIASSPDQLDDPTAYATLDHILPVSKGGTNRTLNLQLAHSRCNNEKGDKIIEVDTETST